MPTLSIQQRVYLAAAACVAAHQVQSFVEEPEERQFRINYSAALLVATVLFFRGPRGPAGRVQRGLASLLVGAGPTFGVVAGHAVPLFRRGELVPASETAILNLGGGAFLVMLGVALLGGWLE